VFKSKTDPQKPTKEILTNVSKGTSQTNERRNYLLGSSQAIQRDPLKHFTGILSSIAQGSSQTVQRNRLFEPSKVILSNVLNNSLCWNQPFRGRNGQYSRGSFLYIRLISRKGNWLRLNDHQKTTRNGFGASLSSDRQTVMASSTFGAFWTQWRCCSKKGFWSLTNAPVSTLSDGAKEKFLAYAIPCCSPSRSEGCELCIRIFFVQSLFSTQVLEGKLC
jgi:hypothetical protein